MKQETSTVSTDSGWKGLYTAGGVAALIAGIVFRRNLGAEIGLFSPQPPPDTVTGWFAMLQASRLFGLAYLNVFDVVNYALVGVMFLALLAALWQVSKSWMAVAALCSLFGILTYFSANTALSMVALSDQYAAAESEALKNQLAAAGQALLALNRFSSPGAHPGSGGLLSLFFVAAAGFIASLVMLRSAVFNRATAYVGLLANGLDLAYCLAYVFLPGADAGVLALTFIPAAGLFFMAWHILVGLRLLRFGRAAGVPVAARG